MLSPKSPLWYLSVLIPITAFFSFSIVQALPAPVQHRSGQELAHKSVGGSMQGQGFEAYADNGGTVLGIAGKDYCLMAADTRLVDGYSINSRNISRICHVSSSFYVAADILMMSSL
jgi:hypothetical protein